MLNYMELVIRVLFKLNRDNSVCLSLSLIVPGYIIMLVNGSLAFLLAYLLHCCWLKENTVCVCVLGHRLFFISVLLFPSTLIAICCMIFELSFSAPSYLLAGCCLGDVDLRRNWAQ